jgi:SAM-dependent methyltransferase
MSLLSDIAAIGEAHPMGRDCEHGLLVKAIAERVGCKRTFVDIGCNDGVTGSNVYELVKDGWDGIGVDMDGELVNKTNKAWAPHPGAHGAVKMRITPLLAGDFAEVSESVLDGIGVLGIDIDSYDFDMLWWCLRYGAFPDLIVAEIAEFVPPPVRFVTKASLEELGPQTGVYSFSIEAAYRLANGWGYKPAWLEYNNIFLVRTDEEPMSAREMWKRGWLDKKDRYDLFFWDKRFEGIENSSPEDAIAVINREFAAHAGKYTISL